jgi:hypothetical protein
VIKEYAMFRNLLMIIMILFSITLLGCSKPDSNLPPTNGQQGGIEQPSGESPGLPQEEDNPSLGGVMLGMSIQEVTGLLGDNYSDEIVEEGGYFGESYIRRSYNGCDLVIGRDSGQVKQIDVYSADYPTNLGVKVGDPTLPALEQYRLKYDEYVGNQSPETLAGWFVVEPGTLLIFSSQENRDRINKDLTPDSKIYGITLGRMLPGNAFEILRPVWPGPIPYAKAILLTAWTIFLQCISKPWPKSLICPDHSTGLIPKKALWHLSDRHSCHQSAHSPPLQ